jgi:hypothetical protein
MAGKVKGSITIAQYVLCSLMVQSHQIMKILNIAIVLRALINT